MTKDNVHVSISRTNLLPSIHSPVTEVNKLNFSPISTVLFRKIGTISPKSWKEVRTTVTDEKSKNVSQNSTNHIADGQVGRQTSTGNNCNNIKVG